MSLCNDSAIGRFALFTDFGPDGPYLGQLQAVLNECAPHLPVINLLSNAPLVNPKASAYLLAALSGFFPEDTLFLTVVDPGVGGDRMGLIVKTERHLFVGPDNGLMSQVADQSKECYVWKIDWAPTQVSPSFHGRDIFAPIAAKLANNESVSKVPIAADSIVGWDWPETLFESIYIDHYGNVFTGIRETDIKRDASIYVGANRITFAQTFSDVLPGELFWYINSCGLVEIAANSACASDLLGLKVGDAVRVER